MATSKPKANKKEGKKDKKASTGKKAKDAKKVEKEFNPLPGMSLDDVMPFVQALASRRALTPDEEARERAERNAIYRAEFIQRIGTAMLVILSSEQQAMLRNAFEANSDAIYDEDDNATGFDHEAADVQALRNILSGR